jgi:hypothetical protein
MNIEQAIFTSAKTAHALGYQVVSQSPGVHQIDARELAAWCPSHDSLLGQGTDALSFNFHPLPSGAFCVSRTVPAGLEYSGRGGMRVYTHCLIVPAEVLASFANNPFEILRVAMSAGAMEVREPLPTRLEPLTLSGKPATVDQALLAVLGDQPGPSAIGVFVQAALDALCLAVACGSSPEQLFAGLFSCLPLDCRLEFSFSTGLKYSGRRPFRLIALPDDPGERRWLLHQNNVAVLDLTSDKSLPAIPIDGWAQFIERVLASGRVAFLASELCKRRVNLKPDDLPALGLQLLEELDAAAFASPSRDSCPSITPDNGPDDSTRLQASPSEVHSPADEFGASENCADGEKPIQKAHAAHRQFEKAQAESHGQPAGLALDVPSAHLVPESPEMLEKLELLDDLVYDAIAGRPGALEQLQSLWPVLREELDRQMLAESREQYLRYALTIWEGCVNDNNIRNPAKAVQALDVLCMLFEE